MLFVISSNIDSSNYTWSCVLNVLSRVTRAWHEWSRHVVLRYETRTTCSCSRACHSEDCILSFAASTSFWIQREFVVLHWFWRSWWLEVLCFWRRRLWFCFLIQLMSMMSRLVSSLIDLRDSSRHSYRRRHRQCWLHLHLKQMSRSNRLQSNVKSLMSIWKLFFTCRSST